MKKVIITRGFSSSQVTLGWMQIEGVAHEPLVVLENPQRATSVDSCIPKGTYLCKPHNGKKYQGVWEVCDVPGRTAILIHAGNTEKDTLGCILVGLAYSMQGLNPSILSSKAAIEKLRGMLGNDPFQLIIM